MTCTKPQCQRARALSSERYAEMVRLNKALARAQKAAELAEPTTEEVRALYKLAVVEDLPVTLRHLRTWAKTGEGPQPSYEDVEGWVSWVAEKLEQ